MPSYLRLTLQYNSYLSPKDHNNLAVTDNILVKVK